MAIAVVTPSNPSLCPGTCGPDFSCDCLLRLRDVAGDLGTMGPTMSVFCVICGSPGSSSPQSWASISGDVVTLLLSRLRLPSVLLMVRGGGSGAMKFCGGNELRL